MESNSKQTLNRGEFLRGLGLSTSALMAFYCIGTTLSACSSGSVDPDNGTTPTTGGDGTTNTSGLTGNASTSAGTINFTLDLTSDTYKKLLTAGEYVIVGDILVAFSTTSLYVALSKVCTHEGTTVQYRKTQNDVYCSNHSSVFTLTGSVKDGPAPTALKAYTAKLSSDGKQLTVS